MPSLIYPIGFTTHMPKFFPDSLPKKLYFIQTKIQMKQSENRTKFIPTEEEGLHPVNSSHLLFPFKLGVQMYIFYWIEQKKL